MAQAAKKYVAPTKMAKKLYGEAQKDEQQKKPGKEDQDVNYEHSSVALLALQPDDLKEKVVSPQAVMDWEKLRTHMESRLNILRQWRNSWWNTNWNTLALYLLPRRSIWLTQTAGGWPTPNNMNRGRMLNDAIKDPTGTYAVRVCAAGLMSGLASPSRPWFKVITKIKNFEPDADGRKWMDEIEDRIYTVLAGSNFYNSFAQECEDLVVYGTAPTIIYEDEKELIRCYNPANGEYYLSSGATMRVDALYRQFVMTVSQIVDFFGIESCPEQIKSLWEAKSNSLDQEWAVAHCIEPNFTVNGVGKIPGNFAYREIYWLYGQGAPYPLSKRGFVDPPFTAPRWATQSNDAYGRSPGMDVLPDVIQLQVMTVRLSEAIEKQVRPPLLADITMKNQPSSSLPGTVTYVQNLRTGSGMRSMYEVNPDIKGLAGLIEQIGNRVKMGLFNDLFLMLESAPQKDMTATEVQAKLQEKMTVLGPVVENLLGESLRPKLKMIYGIMQRKGMLPEPPDSMRGVPLELEFTSLLAIAQKAASTSGLERIAALIGNLAAVYGDAAKNILDVDIFLREFNTLLVNPEKIFRSPEAVKQIGQEQAQQAKEAQQMEAVQHGAQTASIGADAANTLAATQVGSGQTALQAILGTGAAGAQ